MRKYFDESSEEVITAKNIAEKNWQEMLTSEIAKFPCFNYFETTIVNPFMDDTGRQELNLDEAYEFYGSGYMNWFIDRCNNKK